jgi:hypothetical protein
MRENGQNSVAKNCANQQTEWTNIGGSEKRGETGFSTVRSGGTGVDIMRVKPHFY